MLQIPQDRISSRQPGNWLHLGNNHSNYEHDRTKCHWDSSRWQEHHFDIPSRIDNDWGREILFLLELTSNQDLSNRGRICLAVHSESKRIPQYHKWAPEVLALVEESQVVVEEFDMGHSLGNRIPIFHLKHSPQSRQQYYT